MNLLQRLMLWSASLILAVFACILFFLNLRIVGDMRSLVQLDLTRTRMLFERLHRIRGEDLTTQCSLLAGDAELREAIVARAHREVREVIEGYAKTAVGARAILVVGLDGKPLAGWWHPDLQRPRVPFASSIKWAFSGQQPPGIDVSKDGIYQTAWAPVQHPQPWVKRPIAMLILGTPIDDRLARNLKDMSGADITFFPAQQDASAARSALPPAIVASTLTLEARRELTAALFHDPHKDPRKVPATGLAQSYEVDLGDEGRYLAVPAPIKGMGGEVIGAYIIQRPLGEEDILIVSRAQRMLLWVGLFAVLASVGISYLVANPVARRILRVVRAAEGLSRGDWSLRVPEEGPMDIRILAEAFNHMAARLQGWDAELRAEVALRTEELNQALARLDSNLHQMRQFHADASHELRTPLTIMRGEVEVALRTPRTPEEYQRVLVSILEEMNRVASIVEHLLLLARADSGQIQIQRRPIEVNEILEELHPQVVLLAAPKHITVDLDEAGRVSVMGDAGKLRQLFLNLIDNAIKYTPEGGSITVRVAAVNSFATVAITDTGIGIAQEDIPHIFDRFFRVDRARSREMGGTGLGLAICQWIIDAHHGWIDVQSALGKGSTFTVHLPCLAPETPDAPASGAEPAREEALPA